MLEFGLTGGIGSGKSTVSELLASRGATIIDADAIVRDLQLPGELVFEAMVERWGSEILVPAAGDEPRLLDRAAVAEIVFNDADELAALNAIVHPAVFEEAVRRVEAAPGDGVVVHDIPLLVHPGGEVSRNADLDGWAGVIVVDTPTELAIDRVVDSRGMEADDVRARMESQASRDERRAIGDYVIDNSGSLGDLLGQVEQCWEWMLAQKSGEEAIAGESAEHPERSEEAIAGEGESAE